MVTIQMCHSEARFSNDGKYRYLLSREWDKCLPTILFIMLNPSTADAEKNDPTVARCVKWAHEWGYGTVEIANLFALRATNPSELAKADDPVGPHNLCMIENAVKRAYTVVGAWGTLALPNFHMQTIFRVRQIIEKKTDLYCLGRTKDGNPAHPLYLKGNAKPFIYRRKKE